MQVKNSDYLKINESKFSEEHLFYKDDGFVGFSDFLTIGDNYTESGFLPYAVAIHLSYADAAKRIRIMHFVSDSNDDTSDVAGKFEEALTKLVKWCDLKKINIEVINLRGNNTYDPIFLAEEGQLESFLIHLPFVSKLEHELSKPRRRSDNELDYLPTQYLSELIKSMDYDGVEYQSSLHKEGYNLAIFKPEKFVCKKVEVCEIVSIELKHKVI